MKAQRLRIRYRVTAEGSGLSQRELVNAWEQAAQAAGLPLAYSEGKRPGPQISLAAPLPQGVTSDWELADVYLAEWLPPDEAWRRLAEQLPVGVEAVEACEVGVGAPSLQSQLRWAEYEAEVPAEGLSAGEAQEAIAALLRADTLPAEYRRETKVRQYDLRPLVLDIHLEGERDGCLVLSMRLRAEPEMTARADQVLLALGLPTARRTHRRRLYLQEVPAAVLAYRRYAESLEE